MYSEKKEEKYQVLENAAFHVMRNALIDFYLERKDFISLKKLTEPNWKEIVIEGNLEQWKWVVEDVNGDYFITENAYTQIDEEVKSSKELEGLSGDEYQYEYHFILSNAVEFFVSNNSSEAGIMLIKNGLHE